MTGGCVSNIERVWRRPKAVSRYRFATALQNERTASAVFMDFAGSSVQ
jgi:hypothetical protein